MVGLLRKLHGLYKRRFGHVSRDWLNTAASWCGGLTGKRVLDVGCDLDGAFVCQIARQHKPREVIGLNLGVRPREFSSNCRLEAGDIRKTSYPDNHFDVLISLSAFEHLHNFDVALREMHRILQPGGVLFSIFGPIWSAIYGHHLWVWHQGRRYYYWNVILPPFCHLIMSEQEVCNLLCKTYPADLARILTQYVFSSPEQNQLFFEDYEAIVRQSPFRVLFFKGCEDTQLVRNYHSLITPDVLESLHSKYPQHTNFMYDGISMLLKKPS